MTLSQRLPSRKLARRVLKHDLVSEPFADLPFVDFCARWLRIQDKSGQIVPLVLNRAQRDIARHLALFDRILILKARQIGVSTVVQAWHYYNIVNGHTRASTLCHDDDLTAELREMADRFQDNIPDPYRPSRKYANAKVTTYPDRQSRARIATVGGHASRNSAGKKKGRGGSNTDIHGTEVAFWPDVSGVMSAAMQAGSPRIVLESTPNGMAGAFYEWVLQALDGLGIWKILFYEWWWDDNYQLPLDPGETLTYTPDEQSLVEQHGLAPEQIKWRRAKQAELPHEFAQEYPEDPYACFLASGTSYFRNIEHVFVAPDGAQPEPGRRYVGGLDFGQTDDYTALGIFDQQTFAMVDYLRIHRLKWQEMRRQISVMANKWDAVVVGEANAMGSTNIELLQTGEVLDDGTRIEPVKLLPFDTTSQSKPPLIQALYHALHEEGITLLNRPELRHEFRAFVSVQLPSGHWRYEGGDGAHDDTVMMAALANRALHTASFVAFY